MAGRPPALQPYDGEATERLWAVRMVLFMRMMAGLELLKGVVHWCELLGIGAGDAGFEHQSVLRQGVTIYFAVLDPVAAVGLWMAAPWGAVIWLFAAASQLSILFLLPSFPPTGWLLVPYELLTIAAYVVIATRGDVLSQPRRISERFR